MYLGALIQLPDGKKIAIEEEGKGPLGILRFIDSISKYASKENKLVKVCSDDVKAGAFLQKSLSGVKVEYGLKGFLEMELNET